MIPSLHVGENKLGYNFVQAYYLRFDNEVIQAYTEFLDSMFGMSVHSQTEQKCPYIEEGSAGDAAHARVNNEETIDKTRAKGSCLHSKWHPD